MANVGTVDFAQTILDNTFSTFHTFHYSQSTVYQYLKYLHAGISRFNPHLYRSKPECQMCFPSPGISLKIYGLMPSFNIRNPLYTENKENVLYI
jgi:hypothetical protein